MLVEYILFFTIVCAVVHGRSVANFKMAAENESTPLLNGRLRISIKLSYSLGHIFNDLAAAMWFSYTLLYLQRIALFEPITAGTLLLLGQVVDALSTPIFGILVDRYNKKKIWHIIGSVMVTVSFPAIFGTFLETSVTTAMIVYVASITIFQIGWAAVQISHLSMIPAMTNSPLERADLTAMRYSAQVGAAVVVFVITWIVLPSSEDPTVKLNQQDASKFRNIVLICTGLGVVATVLFHIFLKTRHIEQLNGGICTKNQEPDTLIENVTRRRFTWSATTLLLRVALLYVASRLFITLATVYLPLYIEELDVGLKQELATIPLTSYLSSFAAAILLKYITEPCGTKGCYLLGALIGILSAIVTEYAGSSQPAIYGTAILIGAGSSITMVTALSVTAELIGPRTESSALVYSIVTFLDKIVTGLVVILIERMRCLEKELCPNYNRNTLAVVCASSMILGLLTLMSVARCLN
ncbi:major facilitator superfamily domain-containing protein 12 isoform X2 [Cephus cinctus]|uniref:Major facilitator superfamily domain-containing protein 12 isoform X2 n=1 Tax=Cephus cinctus TaxID=211228 RepID=A0AAJ7RGH1_CEPCN|nr:major facilitator superfamily domain-containing protein 12 isoform X2 [Cephus cinctus]